MKPKTITFKGYSSPNYTPVPDELFDEQLPDLSGAELKVLLYIIRRTFGFKKESDNISLNQLLHGIVSREGLVLDRGTGLSKKTLLETIKSLVEKNLIITERRRSAERGDEPTTYRLHILDSHTTQDTTIPRGVENTPGGVEKSTPLGSDKKYSSQETVQQQTDVQYRNSKAKAQDKKGLPQTDDQESGSPVHTGIAPLHHLRAGEYQSPRTATPTSVADILAKHQPPSGKPAPTATTKRKPTPQLMVAITEISENFADMAKLRSNTTQAINLWQQSGRSEASFVSSLYEARAITRQQRNVRRPMPYFWRVVRDLVGVSGALEEEEPNTTAAPTSAANAVGG